MWSALDTFVRSRVPLEPTSAWPGSAEKIAVLAWRHANGYVLWHPDDVRLEFPSWVKARTEHGRFFVGSVPRRAAKVRAE